MLRPGRPVDVPAGRVVRPDRWCGPMALVGQGLAVGGLTGLVGAGGGFIVVPALAMLAGLPMPAAVGTSLLIITLQSLAGLAGQLHGSHLPWTLALPITGLSVAGALAGGRLTGRIQPERLRRVFGWLIVAMAIFVAGMQAPWSSLPVVERPAIAVVVLVVLAAVAGAAAIGWRRRARAVESRADRCDANRWDRCGGRRRSGQCPGGRGPR